MALVNCPECNKEISNKAHSCPHCGCPISSSSEYTIYMVGYRDTDTAVLAGLNEVLGIGIEYEELVRILNNLPYKVYECNAEETAVIIAKKLDKWWIDVNVIDSKGKAINTSIVLCPKCSSTNVQVVPRKWSLIAGKTDRVCANCKCKW